MKKNILVLLFFIIFNTVGCSNTTSSETEYDFTKISEELLLNIEFDDELSKVDNDLVIQSLYNVKLEDLEDVEVYVSSMATAEEIALFKFKDVENANDSFVKERIQYQKETYKDYNSTELIKLNNPYIKIDGRYVFCVVANDISKCKEIIK